MRHPTAKTNHFEIIPVEDVLKRVPGATPDKEDNATLDDPIGGPKSRKTQLPTVSPRLGDRKR